MKVKEKYSKEFKRDDKMKTKQKCLKEKGNLVLLEQTHGDKDLPYKSYGLYDKGINIMYIKIDIPDPRELDLHKDILLKYQGGIRIFMKNLFDVIIGEKEDLDPIYTHKQKKDLIYHQNDDGSVCLYLAEEDTCLFGIIDFLSKEKNLKIGKSFVNYFEGIPIEETWREICEQ